MKILITGATGLVGTQLVKSLTTSGYEDLRILTRDKSYYLKTSDFPIEAFEWDPDSKYIENGALKGVDIIIHLAGESVAEGRWSKLKKEKILNSRINGTKLLIDEIKKLEIPPKKFISSSAVGIYGNRDEESLSSNSELGTGFLAEVCKKWESIALDHKIEGMKSHCIRTGIVLSTNGGALTKMLAPFKAGVGGKLGTGDQYMSWIHIDDLVGQFIFLLENQGKYNIYNGVSPRPVSNYIFTKILGKELRRPTLFPVPAVVLKFIFGEMSEILLASQKVIPTRFIEESYNYKFRSLKEALINLLQHNIKGEEQLLKYQWINYPPKEVFEFFTDEKNLEKITPSHLKFKVQKKSTEKIKKGTFIDYKLSLHGIPLRWKSEISSFEYNQHFVDKQVKGPYSKWNHYHGFIPLKKGTLIVDKITYKVPMGLFGLLFMGRFVRNDLNKIFNFRKKIINQLFTT